MVVDALVESAAQQLRKWHALLNRKVALRKTYVDYINGSRLTKEDVLKMIRIRGILGEITIMSQPDYIGYYDDFDF